MTVFDQFQARGWAVLPPEESVAAWSRAALAAGAGALADPVQRAEWLQCEGTWFVGVDALPNAADGSIDGVPLKGAFLCLTGPMPALHRAQLSVTWPGYPKPRYGESDASFAYRRNRDAAHVDGLLPIGPTRQRQLREPHAFILGLPLTECDPGASPLVVWSGSHKRMGMALCNALAKVPEAERSTYDLTQPYINARREVFEICPRHEISVAPGGAIVLHRHLLHGIAPWREGARAPAAGRQIAYFRPQFKTCQAWMNAEFV